MINLNGLPARFFLILLLLSSITFSVDWYVNATAATSCLTQYNGGSTCVTGSCNMSTTIALAVANASNGDNIYVCRNSTGHHAVTTVSVNKAVNLFGNQSDTRIIGSPQAGVYYSMFDLIANGINVSNLTIMNATDDNGASVTIAIGLRVYSNETKIWENTIRNVSRGIQIESVKSLSTTYVSVNISNNTIFNTSGSSVFVVRSSNASVMLNMLYNISSVSDGAAGVLLQDSHNITVMNNTIWNFTSSGSTAAGIEIDGTNHSIIANNTILNGSNGMRFSSGVNTDVSYRNLIQNNTIINMTTGINVAQGSNNTLRQNVIRFSRQNGVETSGAPTQDFQFDNNTVANNTWSGFHISSGTHNFTNNIIYNNTVGINLSQGGGDTADGNKVQSNVIENNTYGVIVVSDSNNITLNTIRFNTQAGILLNYDSATDAVPSTTYIFTNNIANHSQGIGAGIFVRSVADVTHIFNNTIQNSTMGIYVNSSNSTNITYNQISVNTYAGIYLNRSPYTDVRNNHVATNLYGYVFDRSAGNITTSNASNNSLAQYHFINNANITLTGVNRALSTPTAALDFNISNSSNATTQVSTSFNDISTENLSFYFTNTTNVTIKVMGISLASVQETGCLGFVGTCTLITNNTNVINVTNANASTAYDIQLGIYYNASTSADSADIFFASYFNGWNQLTTLSSGIPTTSRMARRLGTLPGTFGVVSFRATTSSSSASSSSTASDSSSNEPAPPQPPSPPPDTAAPEPTEPPVTEPASPQDSSSSPQEPAIPPSSNQANGKDSALESIAQANNAIQSAQNQDKDVSAARKKLDEASKALQNNDYAKASLLAQEAARLAQGAKAGVTPVETPTEVTTPQEQGSGIGIILGVVSVIGLAGLLYYFMIMKK